MVGGAGVSTVVTHSKKANAARTEDGVRADGSRVGRGGTEGDQEWP